MLVTLKAYKLTVLVHIAYCCVVFLQAVLRSVDSLRWLMIRYHEDGWIEDADQTCILVVVVRALCMTTVSALCYQHLLLLTTCLYVYKPYAMANPFIEGLFALA